MRSPRRVVVLDRVIVAVVGLALIVAGVLVAAAGSGHGDRLPVELASRLDRDAIDSARAASWWAPTLAAGGVVLVLLALWWLVSHLPAQRSGPARLAGSRPSGRLEVVPAAVARAATRQVCASPHVRSARLRLVRAHGRVVLTGTVRIGPHAPLALVGEEIALVVRQTSEVLGDDALTARIHLALTRRDTSAPSRRPN